MTDTDTSDPTEVAFPEKQTYRIQVQKAIEVDLSEAQVQAMKRRFDGDPEEAVEEAFLQRELDRIEPEQKLLDLTTSAEVDDG